MEETPTPYVRYVANLGGTPRLFYGLAPDAGGWSRVIGWFDPWHPQDLLIYLGLDEDHERYVRALGAGIRHASEMSKVEPLAELPVFARHPGNPAPPTLGGS